MLIGSPGPRPPDASACTSRPSTATPPTASSTANATPSPAASPSPQPRSRSCAGSARADVQGLYVAEFPDRVKIGISTNLPERYRDHVKAGATRGTLVPTGPIDYARLQRIEDTALVAAEDHGRRLRSGRILLESFAGLPFDTA